MFSRSEISVAKYLRYAATWYLSDSDECDVNVMTVWKLCVGQTTKQAF